MQITHFANIRGSNKHTWPPSFYVVFWDVCFLGSTAFVSTPTGIDYFNSDTEYISRVTFFLNESVPADLISDTWNKVVDFYLGSDRVVTTTNVHNIINVSVI